MTPPSNAPLSIAFVMEQTLGSVTHYLNLRAEESAADGVTPRWLPIDYRRSRVPWAVTGSFSARRALSAVIDRVAGVFIHTTTIALLAPDLFRRKRTVLSSDGTPANKRAMRGDYGLKTQSWAAEMAKRAVYREIFKRASAFVAWSHWTKDSFVNDYGCNEEDVVVIPPGIHLTDFAAGDRSHALPRILFVGGDFERKGGEMLLDVFRRRLAGRAELILVTRSAVPPQPGVTVHNDVTANSPALRRLYASCDIFALPTRADCYSVACMEALASGMPMVVTRVGGIPDLVREGETGHLIEVNDSASLGDALEDLVVDEGKRVAMGLACRTEAERRFDARANAKRLFEFVRSRC